MAVWIDGSIHHTSVVPVAGDQVTNDISMALRTPTQHAESIKIQYACALSSLAGADQNIEVPSVGDRQSRSISRHALAEVVEARYEEIFSLVLDELRRSGYAERIPAGIVVTGGTSLMEGATELAERVFDMPVRMSVPVSVKGMSDIVDNPIFSTGVGLIMYGIDESDLGMAQQHASSLKVEESRQSVVTESTADVANKMWRNMKSWVKSNF
jgi:cell division protein FtsA